MIPNRKQWQQWSLPSKYTTIGLLISIISIVVGVALSISASNTNQNITKKDIKQAYQEIQKAKDTETEYNNRYLKERLANFEKVEILNKNNKYIARVYYYSYWEGLTFNFRASVEIRMVTNLNKSYKIDEGWGKATLIKSVEDYKHTIHLGESQFIEIRNISKGRTYDIRMVDFNYDSDEPPSLPFRFQVL